MRLDENDKELKKYIQTLPYMPLPYNVWGINKFSVFSQEKKDKVYE